MERNGRGAQNGCLKMGRRTLRREGHTATRGSLIVVLGEGIDVAGQIEHLVENQAVRGRGGAGALAVAPLEERRERVGGAPAVFPRAHRRASTPPGASSARTTAPSSGKSAFSPAAQAFNGSGRESRSDATCPRAWTPESVRPAPVTRTGSPHSRAAAASTTACTLRPLGCTCHPTNPAPSYSSVSFSQGTTSCRSLRRGWGLPPRPRAPPRSARAARSG